MKKLYLIVLLVLTGQYAFAGYTKGYYDKMEGQSREMLKRAAKESVARHQTLPYYDLPNYWQYSDVYPDLVDGLKRWWDMYSDQVYLIQQGMSGKQSFSQNKMQREHAVPKSWWKQNGSVEYTPAYSDMWNLYPSDGAANQAKLNYPFGMTQNPRFNNGVTRVGPANVGLGGGSANVFEPADEYKGDFARACFYMATVYDDINWVINYMFTKEAYPTLMPWAVQMLLHWSRIDPVSQKEIDRNNYVEQYQGNRNPFVDFPELCEYIWGSRTTQRFYAKDQETIDPTPPITGDPEITAPINGESLDFGQVVVNHAGTRALQIKGANLTSPLSVRVVGQDKKYFIPEVSSIPAATMNQNGGYLLNITYMPDREGRHEASLALYDGGISGSIAVSLYGEAVQMPDLPPLTALDPVDVSGNSYTARWEPAQEEADYYILTRVRHNPGNEETETYETGETSFTFTDRDPLVAESYMVAYSRYGISSIDSNVIYVAAGTGIDAIHQEAPFRVLPIDGGFTILRADGQTGSFRVADLSGLTVIEEGDAADGSEYLLEPGIYILTSGNFRPVKIVVR